MEKNIPKQIAQEFNQKKVNHVFHYTKKMEFLLNILKDGFQPSYCNEKINDLEYYIPMVSFCNIPLTDVDNYMRYGKYGIGLSLDWAIRNRISPVVYIHENTPFANLHKQINAEHLMRLVGGMLKDGFDRVSDPNHPPKDFSEEQKFLMAINEITVPAIQFFKNWKTVYGGKEITTYLEREWRYVPTLDPVHRLISNLEHEKEKFENIAKMPKPHFPLVKLDITSINDLRYIMIEKDDQRNDILLALEAKFTKTVLIEAILAGRLLIFTGEQVRNDF